MRSANAGLVVRIVVASLCVTTCGVATRAVGQDRLRVAVAPFDGAGAPVMRRSVIRSLEDSGRVDVADESRTDDAARSHVDTPSLARELGVQLVVRADVSGRPNRRVLALVAQDAEGRQLARTRTRVPNGANGRRAIDDATRRLLDRALAAHGGATTTNDTSGDDDDVPPGDDGDVPPPPRATPSGYGADPAILVVTGGLAVRSRDALVDVAGGMSRAYDASPYAELVVHAELRPLPHEPNVARGLFLDADAAIAVGLASELPDRSTVSTTFARLSARAGWLIPFEQWLEVGPTFGVGFESFDLGSNAILPAVQYPYLRPGVRARFRAVGEALVFGLDVGYRALLSREGWSTAFGADDWSWGYDLGASISGVADFGLAYGVEAGWQEYVHSFEGAYTLDPAGGANDRGYRFTFVLGWSIR